MAGLFLFKNIIYSMLLMGLIPVAAEVTEVTFGYLPQTVAGLFMFIIISPEICIMLFKDLRIWVKNALEDNDGKFDKEDLIDVFLLYSAVLPVRAVAFGYLLMMIGGWDPSTEQLYGPLSATVISGGLSYFNNKNK